MNEALLAAAFRMQKAGNLAEAAKLCGEILRSNPRHFRALYMLAYIHLGSGGFETAERLFEEAAKLDPKFVDAYFARGCALHNLGRYEEAIATFDKTLSLKRGHADALVNRGLSLLELGRAEDALADFDQALGINPRHVDALVNRGATELDLKRHADAISSLERALALSPNHVNALINMANALRGLGRLDDALTGYDKVLLLEPASVDALSNRGVLLLQLKRYSEALQSFERALALRPDHVGAWFNRGTALLEMRRHREAVASFERALALQPKHLEATLNRAVALLGERRLEEALAGFDSALALDPHRADALGNRAAALYELRRYEEAIAEGEKLIAVQPDYPYAKGLIVRSRLHCCDWRSLANEKVQIAAAVDAGKRVIQPFAYLAISDSPERQLACAQIHARNEFPASSPPLWQGECYRHDRIRVAYISGDFRAHAMSYVMAGVFESHDKERFETIAVSLGSDDKSAIRARVAAAFEQFLEVQDKNDAEIARVLREMEIDIAVDLMGFTSASRTGIFAMRPAPAQVSFLGFPGTMGASYIDYIFADGIVIPEGAEAQYSEKVVRLPDTYYPTDSRCSIADRTPNRAEAGLPQEGFVFCSFNNSYKLMPEMFAVWMRLLHAVDGSVLWLLEDNPAATRNLKREAEAAGIAAERLKFAPKMAPAEHLARHRLADLFLDTLPYNAHTTASDALWAGLPVLTCMGGTFAGRVAASLLHAVGLPDLVTHSLKAYEDLALQIARNPSTRAGLKAKLARNRDTHPLFDTARYTRNLESAFVTMWERHQRGEKPKRFAVGPVP